MAQTTFSITGRRTLVVKMAAALMVAASLATWSTPSAAQVTDTAQLGAADLERAFWACDHASTKGRVDLGTAIACSSATDALKVRKFNGDFSAMLAWWQLNKAAEHLALETSERNAVARVTPAGQR